MSLMRSNDWMGLRSAMDRLVDDFRESRLIAPLRGDTTFWAPAVDISENNDELVVRADLPGVKREDIDIELENNVLSIKGERRLERKDDKENYHFVERSYGGFYRSFTLPSNVDPKKVQANLTDGLLTIEIPKTAEAKARKVEIGNAPKKVEARGRTLAAGSSQ